MTLVLFMQMAMAQAENPLQIADEYLRANFTKLELTQQDVSDYVLSSKAVSKHNRLTHVYLQQTYNDIPVFNAILNLNIKGDGSMLGVGNRFTSDLANKVNTTNPQISPKAAVEAVRGYFRLGQETQLQLLRETEEGEYIFEHRGLALEPIKVKLMFQPIEETVRLAWNVDFYEPTAQHWYITRVDALTGDILDYYDQIIHCEFDEHAFCHLHDHCEGEELASVPDAHAHANFFGGSGDGGSAYRVFPLFIESPNHGDRELLEDPFEIIASPFGWHDTDGVEGADFTITRGNNVHAYHDIFAINQSSGDEPDGGDSLCFDYPLTFTPPQPYTQLNAATTNLFYWNNLCHDIWYHYGFDEESGNFQQNNYGNGGTAGDYVQAEALDGSGTNNANFGTPPDGSRPRMQMFLWGGQLPTIGGAELEVTAPENVAGTYSFVPANFGAEISDSTPELEVVEALDDVGVPTDGCEAIVNADDLVGKVALIDRGECQFGFKALAAQEAGAIAVIVCNNEPGPAFAMGPGAVGGGVTIPALMIRQDDCQTLRMGLPGLTIQLQPGAIEVPLPGPTGRDSDFDNGVIVHEYVHGISTRLTGGRNNSGCLTNFEQAGEGWSDWFALVMTATSADSGDDGRGIGTYSSGQPTTGGGIRPFPYSRNMSTNPHTFSDINSVSVPHGVGSIWCVTIWDMYWNLVDEYGFDDDIYFGTGGNNIAMQLVMDGLKIQPCNPTFVEARDAIIQADEVNNDGANYCLIWETFARRGLGANAGVAGSESFDLPNDCPPAFRVTKTGVAEANAGDILTYELNIINGRNNTIDEAVVIDMLPEGTTLVEGSSDCNITVEDGMLLISLGEAVSGAEFTCTYQLQTATSPFTYSVFEDNIANDDQWAFDNPISADQWGLRINNANTGLLSLFADNVAAVSDQRMTLGEPVFLDGLNPGLTFFHEYGTEAEFDGGVVEISLNGGETWEDVGAENFVENGYDGELQAGSGNPLAGRPAFTGSSPGFERSTVDLSDYAGETVLIRFRFGTDSNTGSDGWYVDDIVLLGNLYSITNTACTDNEGEQLCSSVTTILYGENPNSTETVLQDRPLHLFPNPTTGRFALSLDQPLQEEVNIQLRSVDGRLLQQYSYQSFQSEELDLSKYSSGVYILQFRTEEGVTTRRVIKD
ncbi:MAG: T9SS-dependent M36 family metallopeptidase [Bacteroidota bacterium]